MAAGNPAVPDGAAAEDGGASNNMWILDTRPKRFFQVATFFHYAVADGIHRLLFASRRGPDAPPPEPPTNQLVPGFLGPPG